MQKSSAKESLTAIWPLFGLRIETPRLVLAVSTGEDLPELARISRTIQPQGEAPFLMSWIYDESPKMERRLLQEYWKTLTDWHADSWHIRFVVYLEGRPIGVQSIWAKDYMVCRSVSTGSWLGREFQRRGYGTEMRAGVLELAFAGLGTQEAHTDYYAGNERSAAVSRKLGYTDNGQAITKRMDGQAVKHFMRLGGESWRKHRMPGVNLHGLDAALELFELPG